MVIIAAFWPIASLRLPGFLLDRAGRIPYHAKLLYPSDPRWNGPAGGDHRPVDAHGGSGDWPYRSDDIHGRARGSGGRTTRCGRRPCPSAPAAIRRRSRTGSARTADTTRAVPFWSRKVREPLPCAGCWRLARGGSSLIGPCTAAACLGRDGTGSGGFSPGSRRGAPPGCASR